MAKLQFILFAGGTLASSFVSARSEPPLLIDSSAPAGSLDAPR